MVSKGRGARVSTRPHLSPSSHSAGEAAHRAMPQGRQAAQAQEVGHDARLLSRRQRDYRPCPEPSSACGCDAQTDRRAPPLGGAGLPGLRRAPHSPTQPPPARPCPHTKLCVAQKPSALPWLEPQLLPVLLRLPRAPCSCRSGHWLPRPQAFLTRDEMRGCNLATPLGSS